MIFTIIGFFVGNKIGDLIGYFIYGKKKANNVLFDEDFQPAERLVMRAFFSGVFLATGFWLGTYLFKNGSHPYNFAYNYLLGQ